MSYHGYRRYRQPIAPARALFGLSAFVAVAGFCFADLWPIAAVVMFGYVGLSGRPGGQSPRAGTFLMASVMSSIIAVAAYLDGSIVATVLAVVTAMGAATAAIVLGLPPIGHPSRREFGQTPDGRGDAR